MGIYSVLFLDSFKGMFIFSLSQETSWFAALEFGKYNPFLVTLVCFLGSVAGALLTFLLGYLLGRNRDRIVDLDDDLYGIITQKFSKYGIYIFLFQMLPFLKVFLLFAGIFLVPFKRILPVVIGGRILYYLYYLFI